MSDEPWGSASQGQGYPTGPPPYGQGYPPGPPLYGQGYPPGPPPYGQGYPPGPPPYGQGYSPEPPPYGQGYRPGPPPYLDPRQPSGYPAQPSVAPEPPPPILWACRLMLLRVAMSVVGVVILVVTRHSLRRRIESAERARGVGLSQTTLHQLVTVGLVSAAVSGLLGVVLFLVLAVYVRRGRQWARIVAWIFCGLGVAGLAFSISGIQGATTLSRLTGGVGGLIDIAIIVLLGRGSSSRYVRDASHWREWNRTR